MNTIETESHELAALRSKIDKYDNLYYRGIKKDLISDAEYDQLKRELKQICPEDERHSRVGVPYNIDELRTKYEHVIPMGSLDNTDDGIAGYADWYQSMCSVATSRSIEICASLKVDGSSVGISYEDGKLKVAVSRGNGVVGENITSNAMNFQYVNTSITYENPIHVRGEAILYKEDFEKLNEGVPLADRGNPRNDGAGIIGRLDGTESDKIRFIAFNVHNGDGLKTEAEKFDFLTSLGFQVVPHKICHSIQEFQNFYDEILANRDKLPFEIDGIVVTVNSVDLQKKFITSDSKSVLHPKFSRAVKFPHKFNTTRMIGVALTVGHTGAVIPTAILETVRVGGVNVSNALLNNWDEIERLGVAIGDEVFVVLAGDIIPKITKVVSRPVDRKLIPEPQECPVCGSPTTRESRGKDGAVCYCTNDVCPAKDQGKVHHWIGTSKKGVGILGIGDSIEQVLWDEGIVKDPADLYTLKAGDFANLVLDGGGRVGSSRAEKIVAEIQSKKCLKLSVFLGSLGIDLLGRRRVILLQQAAGGRLDTLEQWLDDENLASLKADGLGDSIRDAIRKGINGNRALIAKLLANGVSIDYGGKVQASVVPQVSNVPLTSDEGELMSAPVTSPVAGKSFCWTGTRDLTEEVAAAGGIVKDGISKGLDYLVQKDATKLSNKTKKAESYGTKIISVDFLRMVLNGEASLDD